MVRLGRTGTLAVISALSEIADAIETLDKASCHSAKPGFTDTDTLDTLYEVNLALERSLLRLVDVLRDGAQV